MENKISLNTSESMNNLFESQDNKIRLSCVLTDSCSEFDMEVNDRIKLNAKYFDKNNNSVSISYKSLDESIAKVDSKSKKKKK